VFETIVVVVVVETVDIVVVGEIVVVVIGRVVVVVVVAPSKQLLSNKQRLPLLSSQFSLQVNHEHLHSGIIVVVLVDVVSVEDVIDDEVV
jgi:hypothetical protein